MKKTLTLLEAAEQALAEAEGWIHDQLDGTAHVENRLKRLNPIRLAIKRAADQRWSVSGRKSPKGTK